MKKIFLAIIVSLTMFLFVILWSQTPIFQASDGNNKILEPAQIPTIEVENTIYAITSVFEGSSKCPEGFIYAGEIAVSNSDDLKSYYVNSERPEWIYVYQECYDQQTMEPYMGYVRYVEASLQGLTLLRYQGEVYIFLNDVYSLPDLTEIDLSGQVWYDADFNDAVIRELPQGFQPVGETVFDGYDLVPTSELGSNRLPGQQLLANPEQPDILLLRHYSSGLEGPEYWAFVRPWDKKSEISDFLSYQRRFKMNALLKKYKNLKVDGSWIGLELGNGTPYFCTPVGAEIIGWDNGIHYCFIKGFGDMVFCVNPETCCDYNVYPIARNFCDFLGLILTTGNTNTLQQIILWDKKIFEDFVNSPEEQENRIRPEVIAALDTIRKGLDIAPIDTPFEYIKDLQNNFPYEQIPFTNEYYDALGIERPDGTEPEENGFQFETVQVEFKFDEE